MNLPAVTFPTEPFPYPPDTRDLLVQATYTMPEAGAWTQIGEMAARSAQFGLVIARAPREAEKPWAVTGPLGEERGKSPADALVNYRAYLLWDKHPELIRPVNLYRPWHVMSVTQVVDAELCPRRWWYRHPGGLRTKKTNALSFGTQFHRAIEAWIKREEPPTRSTAYVWKAIEFLQLQDRRLYRGMVHNELEFAFPLDGVGTVVGSIDLVDERDPELLHVADFKTGSDPVRYGKTPTELARNTQLGLYAVVFGSRFARPPREIMLTHMNVQSRPPHKVFPTSTTISWGQALETYARFERIARELAAYSYYEVEDVPATPREGGSCAMYKPGGCPYQTMCSSAITTIARSAKPSPT